MDFSNYSHNITLHWSDVTFPYDLPTKEMCTTSQIAGMFLCWAFYLKTSKVWVFLEILIETRLIISPIPGGGKLAFGARSCTDIIM